MALLESYSSGRFSAGLSRPASSLCSLAISAAVSVLLLSTTVVVAKEKKIPRVVTGAVLDEADNGIIGASVVLTDVQTGKKTATYTQEGGHYKFSDLLPTHDYEVQGVFKGLSSEIRKVSIFDNRNTIVLNLRIPPPRER